MVDKNQFQSLLEQILSSTNNLKKDLDQNDPREQTQDDLSQLSLSFQDLREMFSHINPEDAEKLKNEFRALLSGQENLQTYVQDVRKILTDIHDRTRSDRQVQQKISNNLPEDQQDETAQSLLQGFKGLMDQLFNSTQKTGGRR
jgi:DNA-directed RNA polymerase subunit F